jgi:flavorubredoxin
MPKILVLYHSRTGNTEKMAEAIVEGAKTVQGVDIELNYLVAPEILSRFDAIVLGVPTYYHDIPANVKDLLEEIAVKKISLKGKIGAAFGSYGWSTEAQNLVLEIMKNKYEMQIIEPPLLIKYTPDQKGLENCKDFGKKIAEKFPTTLKHTHFYDRRPRLP